DAGSLTVGDRTITGLSRRALTEYRRHVGFVFQRFNLLPALTALDNVIAPVIPQRVAFDKVRRGHELLAAVGLADKARQLPARLSGGEQQRVAIARALIGDPRLILADEPTGNLDSATGNAVIELLCSLRDSSGVTVVIATHDPDTARRCERRLHLQDGKLSQDS
ncbi:MAG: ABC transporter ATP-binding protein, partial [Trebonia sp.]